MATALSSLCSLEGRANFRSNPNEIFRRTVVSGTGICTMLEKPICHAIHVRYPQNNQANLNRPSSSPPQKSPDHPPSQFFCESPIRKLHAMCKSHCPSRKSILLLPTASFSNGAAAIIRPGILGERGGKVYLDESNIRGLLSEALTADVQTILSDQTSLVGADTAITTISSCSNLFPSIHLHNPSKVLIRRTYQARAPLP